LENKEYFVTFYNMSSRQKNYS